MNSRLTLPTKLGEGGQVNRRRAAFWDLIAGQRFVYFFLPPSIHDPVSIAIPAFKTSAAPRTLAFLWLAEYKMDSRPRHFVQYLAQATASSKALLIRTSSKQFRFPTQDYYNRVRIIATGPIRSLTSWYVDIWVGSMCDGENFTALFQQSDKVHLTRSQGLQPEITLAR